MAPMAVCLFSLASELVVGTRELFDTPSFPVYRTHLENFRFSLY